MRGISQLKGMLTAPSAAMIFSEGHWAQGESCVWIRELRRMAGEVGTRQDGSLSKSEISKSTTVCCATLRVSERDASRERNFGHVTYEQQIRE